MTEDKSLPSGFEPFADLAARWARPTEGERSQIAGPLRSRTSPTSTRRSCPSSTRRCGCSPTSRSKG
ncbi:hypothetical protein ACFSTI_21425 [Rhizorhabdus histidinilytica]